MGCPREKCNHQILSVGGKNTMSYENVEVFIVHCSDTVDSLILEDQDAIAKYHYYNKGWLQGGPDTGGYNVYVEYVNNKPEIIWGRPLWMDGAHTEGMNHKSIGFCMVGKFDKVAPPQALLAKLAEAIKLVAVEIGGMRPLEPHSKYNKSKTCPGLKFPMDKLRDMVTKPQFNGTFRDDDGLWSEEDIEKAVKYGLLTGYGDDNFKPENFVKRGELASALVRLYEKMGGS